MAFSGQDLVSYLQQYLGTPYVWGGNSLSGGIDCSGLVQQGLAHFGVSVPRVTYDQINVGKAVDFDNLQVGDTVFFDTDPNTAGPDHVGVYAGNGQMIEAPHTGASVRMTDITSNYYTSHFMGGRRMDDMTDNGTGAPASPETVAKLSPEEMASKYGWAYSFMQSDPGVKNVFNQAVEGSWTPDKFQAAIKDTPWYQKNAETTRNAMVLKTSDPATYNAQVQAAKDQVTAEAAKVGAAVTDKQLNEIADHVVMFGMTPEQINNTLGGYVDFVNGTLKGQAGVFEHNMRQYAGSMGVDLNDDAYKQQAALITRGLSTESDFQNFIRQQAQSQYPAFSSQIDAGQTMKQIANPYVQTMAQSLEMNPNSISLKDPTITSALNGLDANGKPVGKTITSFQQQLRGDPRWNSTQQAQDQAMSISKQVLNQMGLMG
jgi:hypothetical protein